MLAFLRRLIGGVSGGATSTRGMSTAAGDVDPLVKLLQKDFGNTWCSRPPDKHCYARRNQNDTNVQMV